MKKHKFGLLLIFLGVVGLFGFHLALVKERVKKTTYQDGNGKILPDSAVRLMVKDHYVWLTMAESTYLAHYALLGDTAERDIRYTNPLGDSGENEPIMPKN